MKDAVIVLGGGLGTDGSLPASVRARVEKGVALLKRGEVAHLIVSGDHSFLRKKAPPQTEAKAMAAYARELGADEEVLIQEASSKDTFGNAFFTKRDIVGPKGWNDLMVVTSNFHLRRTRYVFGVVFGPEYRITYAAVGAGHSLVARVRHFFQEIAFGLATRWFLRGITPGDMERIGTLLFTAHPAYAYSNKGDR